MNLASSPHIHLTLSVVYAADETYSSIQRVLSSLHEINATGC